MFFQNILVKTLTIFYILQSIFSDGHGSPIKHNEETGVIKTVDRIESSFDKNFANVEAKVKINPIRQVRSADAQENMQQPKLVNIEPLLVNTTWLSGANYIVFVLEMWHFKMYVSNLNNNGQGIIRSGPTSYIIDINDRTIDTPYFNAVTDDCKRAIFMGQPIVFEKPFELMPYKFLKLIEDSIPPTLFSLLVYPKSFNILINEERTEFLSDLDFEDLLNLLNSSIRNTFSFTTPNDVKTYRITRMVLNSGNNSSHLYNMFDDNRLSNIREWKNAFPRHKISLLECALIEEQINEDEIVENE